MFSRGFQNQWIPIFMSVLTGIACVPMLCDEINTGNYRMSVIRIGKTRYITSKFISAMITSVIILVIPFIIFGIICWLTFPNKTDYIEFIKSEYSKNINDEFLLEQMERELQLVTETLSSKSSPLNALFGSESRLLFVITRLFTASLYSIIPCLISMCLGAISSNKFVSLRFR